MSSRRSESVVVVRIRRGLTTSSNFASISSSSSLFLFLPFSLFPVPVAVGPSKYSFHSTGGNRAWSRCKTPGSNFDEEVDACGLNLSEYDSISARVSSHYDIITRDSSMSLKRRLAHLSQPVSVPLLNAMVYPYPRTLYS